MTRHLLEGVMSAILPSSAEASSFADAGTREDMAKPETFERAGLLQRAIDAVFGYDFFLSYSHSDGMAYPARLKNRLEAVAFKVFLDQTEYTPGIELQRETRRQVKKASKFVVVARPAALKSKWVLREVETALAIGRTPLLIDVNGAVQSAPDDAKLAAMARDNDWLRLEESIDDDAPSDHAVAELIRSFGSTRQETKRRRMFAAATAVLAAVAALAVWEAIVATQERNDALRAQSRYLVGRSQEAVAGKRGHIGTLLALEAMPDRRGGRDRPFLREAERALYGALQVDRSVLALNGRCTFAPDFSRATCTKPDGSVRLIEVPGGREIGRYEEMTNVKFSPAGARLAIRSNKKGSHILLLDSGSGKQIADLGVGNDFEFNASSELLVTTADKTGQVVDPTTGQRLHSFDGESARFSASGIHLVVERARVSSIMDASSGRPIWKYSKDPKAHTGGKVAFTADESLIAGFTTSGEIQIVNARRAQVMSTLGECYRNPIGLLFSPDGERLAVLAEGSTSADLWNPKTGTRFATLAGDGRLDNLTFSPDSNRIAASTSNNDTAASVGKLWDARTGKDIATLNGHTNAINGIVFSPRQATFVTFSEDTRLKLWDAATGAFIADMIGHTAAVKEARFSPDGRTIVSLTAWETHVPFDFTARLWDGGTGQLLAVLEHDGAEWEAGFSPDGKRIYTNAEGDSARVWAASGATPLVVASISTGPAGTFAISPDGSQVAVAAANEVKIWETVNGAIALVLKGHEAGINHMVFDATGTRLATASSDKTARIWNVRPGQSSIVLKGHDGPVRKSYFSGDGTRLVTESSDGTARVWDATTGIQIAVASGLTGEAATTVISNDGRYLVVISGKAGSTNARLLDARTGRQLADLGAAYDVIINLDGSRLVALDYNGSRLWDIATVSAVMSGAIKSGAETAVFSRDGERLITYDKPTLTLRSGKTGATIAELDDYPFGVYAKFSSNSEQVLVTASGQDLSQNVVRIYDARTGKPVNGREVDQPLIGTAAAYSFDKKRIAVGHEDGTVRIFDSATLETVALFEPPPDGEPSGDAAFNQDGTRVISSLQFRAAKEDTIMVWRAFPDAQSLVNFAKDFVPRCLTREEREQSYLVPDPPRWCADMRKWPYDH
jgi:WD40 repeat protein